MLVIKVSGQELFDEETQTFEETEDVTVELEHSLISISKWESIYQKPFLSPGKTRDETFGYLKAMVLTPGLDLDVLDRFSHDELTVIQEYIDSPQSATTFGKMPERGGPNEVITSELIYFWMVNFNIPFECQYWHINRLFSLIRICNIKNSPPQEIARNELVMRNRELNAQRRAELGTKG